MTAKRFINIEQFTSDNVQFAGLSAYGQVNASETKNIDLSAPFDLCLTGAVVIVKNAKVEDKVSLQIVHPNGTVLNEFVTNWYLAEDQQEQFALSLNYPANIPQGLILRVKYIATSGIIVRDVMINYLTHRVMEQA